MKPAILYYLRITVGDVKFYKIGITNLSVEKRFGTDMQKISVIKEWPYLLGADAYQAEQTILSLNKEFKYFGPSLLKSGNTEIFTKDVGELDVCN